MPNGIMALYKFRIIRSHGVHFH